MPPPREFVARPTPSTDFASSLGLERDPRYIGWTKEHLKDRKLRKLQPEAVLNSRFKRAEICGPKIRFGEITLSTAE
jgi:hypothetical protein